LVLGLKDKEFNINYNFHDIEIICMEEFENDKFVEIAGIFKDKLNYFKYKRVYSSIC